MLSFIYCIFNAIIYLETFLLRFRKVPGVPFLLYILNKISGKIGRRINELRRHFARDLAINNPKPWDDKIEKILQIINCDNDSRAKLAFLFFYLEACSNKSFERVVESISIEIRDNPNGFRTAVDLACEDPRNFYGK